MISNKPPILLTQAIFTIPNHIGMVPEEMAFNVGHVLCAVGKWTAAQLNVMAMTGFAPLCPGSLTDPVP